MDQSEDMLLNCFQIIPFKTCNQDFPCHFQFDYNWTERNPCCKFFSNLCLGQTSTNRTKSCSVPDAFQVISEPVAEWQNIGGENTLVRECYEWRYEHHQNILNSVNESMNDIKLIKLTDVHSVRIVKYL